jgi:hypothetical protein
VIKLSQQRAGGTRDAGSQAVGSERAGVGTTPDAAAGSPIDPVEAQQVLDGLLGTWSWEKTVFKAKWNPEEKHGTGTYSFSRILGGAFVQQTTEDSEKKTGLGLFTYDLKRRCYRGWGFSSDGSVTETPFSGTWNEATQTLEWTLPPAGSIQDQFASDDAIVITALQKDTNGEIAWHEEYKLTRVK